MRDILLMHFSIPIFFIQFINLHGKLNDKEEWVMKDLSIPMNIMMAFRQCLEAFSLFYGFHVVCNYSYDT
jgi:hypothetical protein